MDIKDITHEWHKAAERKDFVKVLMSGEIDEKVYATYLYNQAQCYAVLEKYAQENSLFRHTPGIERTEHLLYDFKALWKDDKEQPIITQSTKDYIRHVEGMREDAHKLYSHIYVIHLVDLSGGQMIRKKTPGPNRFYTFKDVAHKTYKPIVREVIHSYLSLYEEDVRTETQNCFIFATRLFGEMHDLGKIITQQRKDN